MAAFTWLLKAAVLLSLALVGERLVRALPLRRLCLVGGALGALALPLLSWELPVVVPGLPALAPGLVAEWLPADLDPGATAAATNASAPVVTSAASRLDLAAALTMLWGLGAVLLALRALAGRLWLARVVRRATAAPMDWSRDGAAGVPLHISDELPCAGLVGPWPRAVLLPRSAEGWDPLQRSWVLLHEQAHARAQDDWILLLMQALTVVLWPLPPAWLVQRRARLLAELAADDAVLERGVPPLDYASTLTRLARSEPAGLVAASTGTLLETRVRALLGERLPRTSTTRLLLAGGVAAMVVGAIACEEQAPDSPTIAVPATAAAPTADLSAAVAAELEAIRAEWQPKDAAIVLMDVRSGEVLASGDLSGGALLETPLALGSVLKPFTVAAALEAGVSADVRLPGHSGVWSYGGSALQDSQPEEELTLEQLLTYSSNIGAAELITQIGVAPVRAAFLAVGVEQVPEAEDGTAEAAYLGMGASPAVSPLHLAHAYAILGNDGVDPVSGTTLFQARNVAVVRQGLAAAITAAGTGRAAGVPGMLGGKTGTNRHGEGHIATFAGLWQGAGDPLVVVVVVVEPRAEKAYGGVVAAPSAARLLQGTR